MLQSWLHPLIVYLHHHPHSAGIITFFLVFGEAMAVIGTIFPGSIIMSAVGVLIGSGVIPVTSTFLWAIAGAICGDTLSYLLGFWFKDRLHKMWPFTRWPHWLTKGQKFFKRHGGKSVIIGRFFGPGRSMIPMIAGMLSMPLIRFLLAAIPSASIWAIAYMIPGVLLGALSLELPPGVALEFIGAVLLVLIALLFLVWLIKFIITHFAQKIDDKTRKTWDFFRTHKAYAWITKLLADPHHPENHRQLILAFYALFSMLIFLAIMASSFTHGAFTWLNDPLYHLLRNLRVPIIDNIMLAFTILGSAKIMLICASLILVWFCITRKWRAAIHWLAGIVLASGAILFCKIILFSSRPDHLLNGPTTSSFPSGHTTLSVTIFGLLAVLITKEFDRDTKNLSYITVIILTVLVAFSRLFLGAHWLTDVIGGFALGITTILLVKISYHRSHIPRIGAKSTFFASIIIFVTVWILGGIYLFPKYRHDYTLYWPQHVITKARLQKHRFGFLPLIRENRLGHPKEIFNVEWLGKLSNIKKDLTNQGWISHTPCLTPKGLLYRLSTSGTKNKLPLLPQLYQNRCPVLLMTKQYKNKHTITFRLWESSIKVQKASTPLWLGIVNYYQHPYKLLEFYKNHKASQLFLGATNNFKLYLKNYKWREFIYKKNNQPQTISKLNWDGKTLLITDRK